MARYIIEFRFHGYTKKYTKRLIYEVSRKFRIKGVTRKKVVPHITLFGPFTTRYEKKMVSEVINVAKKYTLVPFKVKGFNFFDNATNKLIYLDIEPSEELKQLRFDLVNRLRKITNIKSSQDRKDKNKFHFHATIAFKDIDKKFDQIWSYLKKKEEPNINQDLIRITILKSGRRAILLQTDDVFLYDSKPKFIPNREAIVKLIQSVNEVEGIDYIQVAHASLAPAVYDRKIVEEIAPILVEKSLWTRNGKPCASIEVGIETGSTRLMRKYMRGKMLPYKPEQWQDVVTKSIEVLNDNDIYPLATLILGLPGEKPEDTRKTIDLIHDLSEYKSLVVPLYFVPIGNLQGKGFFRTKCNTSEHWQLLAACINHDFKWVYQLAEENLSTVGMSGWKIWVIKRVIKIMERKLNPYLKIMGEGINPITNPPTNALKNLPINERSYIQTGGMGWRI